MGTNRLLLPYILCLLVLLASATTTAGVITVQGYDPIPLSDKLTLIAPPKPVFQQLPQNLETADQSRWYQFSLKNNDALTKLWLLRFRTVPHKKLDLFIPGEQGYSLKQLGSESTPANVSPDTIRINLTDRGQQSRLYYIRVQSPYPNQLAPTLLPESVHTLEQYKTFGASTFFQTLALLLLSISLSRFISRRKMTYLFLNSHLLSVNLLLILSQAPLLHWFPPIGDPGHWVLIVTALTLLTAIGCYQQINQPSHYADYFNGALLVGSLATLGCLLVATLLPEQGTLALPSAGSCLAITLLTLVINTLYSALRGIKPAKYALVGLSMGSVGLIASLLNNPWPRSIPVFAEYSLLVAQASFLAFIHWYNSRLEQKQAASISILNSSGEKRRVFEMELRQHLTKPETPFHLSELPAQILATLKIVIPATPAIVMTRQKKHWLLAGTHNAVTEYIRQRIPALSQDIEAVMQHNENSRINIEDARGGIYWLLPLEVEAQHQTLLVLNPVITGDQADSDWHTACDIASHSRALYKTSRQTNYWQQQARLDELTGLPDKNLFTQEIESYLLTASHKEQPYGCLLMVGLSDFKQLNTPTSQPDAEHKRILVAKFCARNLRQQDLLCCYDNNTFAIFLTETNPWQAWHVAERLYKAIEKVSEKTDFTVSIGMSAYTINTPDLKTLFQEADKALRNAQIHSRYRIIRSTSCQDHRLPS